MLSTPQADADELVATLTRDPTHRIDRLVQGRAGLVTVEPDDPLERATTLMLARDYSQLPVLDGGVLRGVVSWRSVGAAHALGRRGGTVADYAEPAEPLPADTSLFAAVPRITEREFVLVSDPASGAVIGIVTATDLSEQFRRLTEPFLLAGEIERQLRRHLDGRFTTSELAAALGRRPDRITSVDSLNLGELCRVLDDGPRWDRVGLPLHRETFVGEINAVRKIRNKVMHFDPAGLDEVELHRLRTCARLLQRLTRSSG